MRKSLMRRCLSLFNVRRAALFLGAMLASSAAKAQPDSCRDILAGGVRDTILNRDTSNASSATKKWFCSSDFLASRSSNNTSAAVTVPIYGVPVEFGYDSSSFDAQQRRRQFCSDNQAQFSNNDATLIFRQVANPNIVRAWSDCMNRTDNINQLVRLQIQRIDSQSFSITAKFSPILSGQAPPTIDYLRVVGGSCSSDRLKRGAQLPVQATQELCRQAAFSDITAVLGTTYGDFSATLKRDFTGQFSGEIRLLYSARSYFWQRGPDKSEQLQTGDHNCRRKCRGEPTRTTYQIEMTADANERFVDPVGLQCIGGPCGGWNAVGLVSQNGDTATASWDVWSRPTTWRLTVGTEVRRSRLEERRSNTIPTRYGAEFTLTVGQDFENPRIEVNNGSGWRSIPITNSSELEVVSQQRRNNSTVYTMKFNPPS